MSAAVRAGAALATLLASMPSVLAWGGEGTAPAAAASLCRADETRWFSCAARNGRLIALCGNAAGSTLQYRFGRPKAVELAHPAPGASAAQAFSYAHYSRAQVERYEVAFSNGGVRYALFDYTEDGRRSAGVSVQLPGAAETQVLCSARATSRLQGLADKLPCDKDSALNQGSCR